MGQYFMGSLHISADFDVELIVYYISKCFIFTKLLHPDLFRVCNLHLKPFQYVHIY